MAQNYGIPSHDAHSSGPHRAPARYLVLITTDGDAAVARLFDAARVHLADVDASTEEVAVMTRGLAAERSAVAVEWDQALAGHSPAERETAEVYTLDV